ncbi:MAG: acyl-CoA synthetase, partial [Actinobacteria bacterium]|nr:acyl-CoA synthetase [Actinomycetota bacterium]
MPINVNFRYLGSEMQYLLDNADCKALVYHASLADRVAEIAGNLPLLTMLVEVDDGPATAHVEGHVRYEDVIASHARAPRIERSPDDVYMLYTGGTTGMPKGVMYRLGEMTASFVGNGLNAQKLPITTELDEAVASIVELRRTSGTYVAAPCCPLMHGTGMWIGAMMPHSAGGTVALLANRKFDADELLAMVERDRVNNAIIVGDAFAR